MPRKSYGSYTIMLASGKAFVMETGRTEGAQYGSGHCSPGRGESVVRIFDTEVQHLKYQVLKEVARHAYAGDLVEAVQDIPKTIVPVSYTHLDVYKRQGGPAGPDPVIL